MNLFIFLSAKTRTRQIPYFLKQLKQQTEGFPATVGIRFLSLDVSFQREDGGDGALITAPSSSIFYYLQLWALLKTFQRSQSAAVTAAPTLRGSRHSRFSPSRDRSTTVWSSSDLSFLPLHKSNIYQDGDFGSQEVEPWMDYYKNSVPD